MSFTQYKAMTGEENINQVPKSNDNPEDVNEISLQEQAIEQSKTQSENMEVHHHPDLHHTKKHWKEYFLEFLMIFLAVTMGFFAESIREHFSEAGKEKEYLSEIIDDLREDSLECAASGVISINTRIGNSCDTLIDILSANNPLKEDIVRGYFMYHRITWDWWVVYFKDATWSQLKNNGGLRLIENRKVVRAVNDYYKWANILNDEVDGIKGRFYAINNNEGRKLFDKRMSRVMLDTMDSKGPSVIFTPSSKIIHQFDSANNLKFANSDPGVILGLCNDLRFYKSQLMLYDGMVAKQGKMSESLIQLIEKEYHLH